MYEYKIAPSELGYALNVLPEPETVNIHLINFCSQIKGLLEDAEQIHPGIGLDTLFVPEILAQLEDATKGNVMRIYNASYRKDELGHPDFSKPRIQLSSVYWSLDKKGCLESRIKMTPKEGFNVKYWGPEPDYITKLREALDGRRVIVRISTNDPNTCV